MLGKKVANDFPPCTNDLLLAQERFAFQLCGQLLEDGPDRDRAICVVIGLG